MKQSLKPFVKWAGGKRWLLNHPDFSIPKYTGRYIEPFLGGGAVFFSLRPEQAILSDINEWLITTYEAIKECPEKVYSELIVHQKHHCKEYFYKERSRKHLECWKRAAQFLYLNRTCWNGLYRENLRGEFNVPIGTKDKVIFEEENFFEISKTLSDATLHCCDFAKTIEQAKKGDLIFADPPYTTAHNQNGFVKYNQKIFSWEDQVRLRDVLLKAAKKGVIVIVTNADHHSIHDLYKNIGNYISLERQSIISGKGSARVRTSEAFFRLL